jgi:hypothetical protein
MNNDIVYRKVMSGKQKTSIGDKSIKETSVTGEYKKHKCLKIDIGFRWLTVVFFLRMGSTTCHYKSKGNFMTS